MTLAQAIELEKPFNRSTTSVAFASLLGMVFVSGCPATPMVETPSSTAVVAMPESTAVSAPEGDGTNEATRGVLPTGGDCKSFQYATKKQSLTNSDRNFSNAQLSCTAFTGAKLAGARFTEANFTKAYLAGAVLVSANLTKAILTNAGLERANFTKANFTGTSLAGARVNGADFTGAVGVNLAGTTGTPKVAPPSASASTTPAASAAAK